MTLNKTKHVNLIAFLLLFIFILLAYANSFKGVWFFDDYPNIVYNEPIQIKTLDQASLKSAASAGLDFPRPLSTLSLGINWYFSQNNILSYHIVNFCIHIISAFFLFLTIKLLLQTPRLKTEFTDKKKIYIIAFFAALLWAIHPIQIPAVTYIVQRMASMSAMFCIIGLYCFLVGRLTLKPKKQLLAFGLCFLSFILGLLSKENAAVFPCILVLAHVIFFREKAFTKKQMTALAVLVVFAVIVLAGMLAWQYNHILELYANRFFTPVQRLLTETRVIFLYISQIFWPLPSRFHIDHYIPLSTSIVNPVSTLFCTLGIFILIVFALAKHRRYPLFSFAILFYFGCHVIESTIMPLELVFEHRNYLPSMFIGMPLMCLFVRIFNYVKTKKAGWEKPLITVGIIIVILMGFSTFLRNYIWTNREVLYEVTLVRYPQLSRPHLGVAQYYFNLNTPETDRLAAGHMETAIANNTMHSQTQLGNSLRLLSIIYNRLDESDKIVPLAKDALQKRNDTTIALILAEYYKDAGDFDESIKYLKQILEQDINILSRTALIQMLWEMQDYDSAQAEYLKIDDLLKNENISEQDRHTTWANIAFGYIAMEQYAKAGEYYQKLYNADTDKKLPIAWFLLGIAQTMDEPLPEAPLNYLLDSNLKPVLDTLEILYTDENIPEGLKTAWQQIFQKYFKPKLEAEAARQQSNE